MQQTAGGRERSHMEYGIPTLVEHNSLEETAQLCRELGFHFIELNMNLPQYQVEKLEKTLEFQNIAEKYELYYTIHLDENLNVCDFNKAVSQAYLDTVKRTIEVARQMNVPILNMHMNPGVYFTLPTQKVYLFQKYKERYLEDIHAFIDLCENEIKDTKLRLSIENTDGYQEFEIEAIERMLQSNVFTLTWDIGHSHSCSNLDEPFMRKHEGKIFHFHVHDAVEKQNHLPLGTGEIDLNERLMLAKKHHCRCVVETKTINALKESAQWLKSSKNI